MFSGQFRTYRPFLDRVTAECDAYARCVPGIPAALPHLAGRGPELTFQMMLPA